MICDGGDGRTANVSMKANKESTVPLSNSNSPLQLNNDSKHTTIRIYRKGGEAFRGVESDGASHLAANRSGSGASEEFFFCRRKRRLARNQ